MKYFGFFLLFFWLMQAWTMVSFLRHYKLTDKCKKLPALENYPKLSIIVTARDEAEKIGQCLTSLLNLNYPELEIIAVNDRSRDATGQMMDKLAAEDNRLRVLHIETLPNGWLGKVHAMHCAGQTASGDFLLFTDGDVIYEADALEKAMRYVTAQQLSHLCLIPHFISGGLWENALVNFFGMTFIMSLRPQSVNTKHSKFYAGVGAFNLISKKVYQQLGGHELLRLEIVDDMRLGRLIKQHGFASHLLLADDLLSLKWHSTVKGVIKGIEKNAFAALDYSVWKLLLLTVIFKFMVFSPYLAVIFLQDFDCLGFALTLLVMHGVYGYCCEKLHAGGWKITWTLPIAAMLTLLAMWNSAVVTLWQGGVKWRDTFYALEMLKTQK
jgi:glycosyltransferase involved in cell wall biosynthesis